MGGTTRKRTAGTGTRARSLDNNETHSKDHGDRPRDRNRPIIVSAKNTPTMYKNVNTRRPSCATTDRVQEAPKDEERCRRLTDAARHGELGPQGGNEIGQKGESD